MGGKALGSALPNLSRIMYSGSDESALSKIYRQDANLAVWKRKLDLELLRASAQVLKSIPDLQISTVVRPDTIKGILSSELEPVDNAVCFVKDVTRLVDMFCYLFDIKKAGLRLKVANNAMCPRFHVDNVPCRLVTTYCGIGTEWLPNDLVDRRYMGQGSLDDDKSGLYKQESDIRRLDAGSVALLKGEHWVSNEGGGLVHRSPVLNDRSSRLLLTLDVI